MSTLKRKDNDVELAVRRLLHAAGCRYRVHYPVPGLPRRTIDIAFTRAKVAVFIDGCFWHGCPEHGTAPTSNRAWWATKLAANAGRDRDTASHLESLGWRVVRIWEHEDATGVVEIVAGLSVACSRLAVQGRDRAVELNKPIERHGRAASGQ